MSENPNTKTTSSAQKGTDKSAKDGRKDRLSDALRANLRRRKASSKQTKSGD